MTGSFLWQILIFGTYWEWLVVGLLCWYHSVPLTHATIIHLDKVLLFPCLFLLCLWHSYLHSLFLYTGFPVGLVPFVFCGLLASPVIRMALVGKMVLVLLERMSALVLWRLFCLFQPHFLSPLVTSSFLWSVLLVGCFQFHGLCQHYLPIPDGYSHCLRTLSVGSCCTKPINSMVDCWFL